MTDKRTKRDNYVELMAIVDGSKALRDCDTGVLCEFIAHELELLDRKRSVSPNSATAKRRAENATYQDAILEILRMADKPLTIKEIQSVADEPIKDFSTSKMSALLTALKKDEKITRLEVKKIVYWTIKRGEQGE